MRSHQPGADQPSGAPPAPSGCRAGRPRFVP